jgi:DNA-directed RNA polymerase specialized sigma24 family protein
LLDRLRSGDEHAFIVLVERYRPSMLRLAAGYVPNHVIAEEVVQDAWLGFLRGLNLVDDRLTAEKMAEAVRVAMVDLPVRQREVVTLRDIEGLTSAEVCGVLDISEASQRALLHCGRSRLRQCLESEFGRA